MIIKLDSRTSDNCQYIDYNSMTWFWYDGGMKSTLKWDKFQFDNELLLLLKDFFRLRLLKYSLKTVNHDKEILIEIDNITKNRPYPLNQTTVTKLIDVIRKEKKSSFFTFKAFIRYTYANNINWLTDANFKEINELKFLGTNDNFDAKKINNINENISIVKRYINTNENKFNQVQFRNSCILQLALELGLRPIQIHTLDNSDLKITSSKDNKYYHLQLPMAKKRGSKLYEKRNRSITNKLGSKLFKLIELNNKNNKNTNALFITKNIMNEYKRITTLTIYNNIKSTLKKIGILDLTLKDIRHFVAQSLADQGTPADIIAEILGHSTTVSAKAYIKLTPKLAAIKQKALNENDSYKLINRMILTGSISDSKSHSKEKHVNGIVFNQYIGGLGACSIKADDLCKKNPIYSCYSCVKFQPFKDGIHQEVKQKLKDQVNYFIDIASKSDSILHNRTLVQLESIIKDVDYVIKRCNE